MTHLVSLGHMDPVKLLISEAKHRFPSLLLGTVNYYYFLVLRMKQFFHGWQ